MNARIQQLYWGENNTLKANSHSGGLCRIPGGEINQNEISLMKIHGKLITY
jgi:hypothetical protein